MSAANLGGASALVLPFSYSIRHCDVPEDCVTIDTGVLEVNARRAISTNNDLQLERQRMSLYVLHRIYVVNLTLSYHRLVQVPT